MAIRAPFDPSNELQRCGELLFKHWTIVIPSAIASVAVIAVVFVAVLSTVVAFLAGHLAISGNAGIVAGVGSGLGVGLGCLFLAFVGLGYATAMTLWAAQDVLLDQQPNLGVAASATLARFGQFALLGLIAIAVSIVPLLLCFVLIGIPMMLAIGYFLMYAPAAVIIGGEGAIAAIGTSIRIARERVGESLVAWIGIYLVVVAGMIAHAFLVHIPFVNLIGGFVVGGFTTAFAELVRARFYLALRIPGMQTTLSAPIPPPPSVA